MTADHGQSMSLAPLGAFRPVQISTGRARDHAVRSMAHRVVQTYLAASPDERRQGERFYSREAHGAARSIAAGHDPDSPTGRFLRTMPSPGERQSEWRSGETEPLPETPERKTFEHKVGQAAGAIARLSPQTDWDRNVRQA